MYSHTYILTHMYSHTYILTHMYSHTYILTHMYSHTYILTHMYSHTHAQAYLTDQLSQLRNSLNSSKDECNALRESFEKQCDEYARI